MKGQMMIEIIVGLGIITSVLVISLVAITHATRLARATRNRLEASAYAKQVLESLRNQRDLDRETFFTSEACNSACGSFGSAIVYTCTMTCNFTPAGNATQAEIIVTMSWDDGGTTASVSIPTVLAGFDI